MQMWYVWNGRLFHMAQHKKKTSDHASTCTQRENRTGLEVSLSEEEHSWLAGKLSVQWSRQEQFRLKGDHSLWGSNTHTLKSLTLVIILFASWSQFTSSKYNSCTPQVSTDNDHTLIHHWSWMHEPMRYILTNLSFCPFLFSVFHPYATSIFDWALKPINL